MQNPDFKPWRKGCKLAIRHAEREIKERLFKDREAASGWTRVINRTAWTTGPARKRAPKRRRDVAAAGAGAAEDDAAAAAAAGGDNE